MALTIVNEQYPPRKPKLTLTADSLDELPTEGVAEGSTATVGGTEYSYDSNAGWIEPGSGGGGDVINIKWDDNHRTVQTAKELYDASISGSALLAGPQALPAAVDEYYASDEDEEPAGYELTYSYFNFPSAGHNVLTLVVCKFRVEMADAETTGFLHAGDAGTAYRIDVT